jgi:hypothetical protein
MVQTSVPWRNCSYIDLSCATPPTCKRVGALVLPAVMRRSAPGYTCHPSVTCGCIARALPSTHNIMYAAWLPGRRALHLQMLWATSTCTSLGSGLTFSPVPGHVAIASSPGYTSLSVELLQVHFAAQCVAHLSGKAAFGDPCRTCAYRTPGIFNDNECSLTSCSDIAQKQSAGPLPARCSKSHSKQTHQVVRSHPHFLIPWSLRLGGIWTIDHSDAQIIHGDFLRDKCSLSFEPMCLQRMREDQKQWLRLHRQAQFLI